MPKVVIIVANITIETQAGVVFISGQTKSSGIGGCRQDSDAYEITLSWSWKTVTWYALVENDQLNVSGTPYCYAAIG